MAFTNAYFSLISEAFAELPKKVSKLPFLANTLWSGDAAKGPVTIIKMGAANIKTYAVGTPITTSAGSADKVVLTLNQYKYFSEILDSTEQLTGQYWAKFIEVQKDGLLMANDNYVVSSGIVNGTNFTTNVIAGASGAAIEVNSANVADIVLQAATLLRVQSALKENSFFAIPSQLYGAMVKAVGKEWQKSNDSYFVDGEVMKFAGLNIIDLPNYVADTGVYTCLFGNPEAIANGAVMGNVEVIEQLETSFGIQVKALHRFGAVVAQESVGGIAKLKLIAG